jgi:hypothetical protein
MKEWDARTEWAATRIQACWRGFLARDDYPFAILLQHKSAAKPTATDAAALAAAALSEMNADLLPEGKVVTGRGGTGKWTRKKAFGFSRHVRSRPKGSPMRMWTRKNACKGRGRNKGKYFGQGHAAATCPDPERNRRL